MIPIQTLQFGPVPTRVYSDVEPMGQAAAEAAAAVIRDALGTRPVARIMIGTGNSQESMVAALTARDDIDWSRIEVFHMDEYVGIDEDHSASFRRWLRTRVADKVNLRAIHYIHGDAVPVKEMIADYARRLREAPLDLTFVGFGENGHIAFNDPHVADFEDPATLKIVDLDHVCRMQQVGEGHFPSLDTVPTHAVTVTCTGLFRARAWIGVVPEERKAEAVRQALTGEIHPTCPGSLIRRHPNAQLFLDKDSASLLPKA